MPSSKSILIIEDETDLAELVCFNLEREGYHCRRATDGPAALAAVRQRLPDLILLDRMLPDVSGDEIATRLKRDPETAGIPIVMLTAKAEESDELVGFALGSDDYITKPFSMKVLIARVRAVFRRSEAGEEDTAVLSGGPIVLNRERFEVRVGETPVSLTATEFRVLQALMRADGCVLDRSQLIDATLGPDVAVTDRTIDVHIAGLRKKLGPASAWVQTVRGIGYTFRAPTSSK